VVGTPLTLSGTVVPTNATNKDITWSLVSGSATIAGNTITATAAGTIVVRATIVDGLGIEYDYTQTFNITATTAGGGTTRPPTGGGGGLTIPEVQPPLADVPEDDPALICARELHKLGLFLGIGDNPDGTPNFDLNGPLTRIQALILTIRLLGLEEEALAFEGPNPFTDVQAWAVPYAAFGYEQGITNGVSADKFAPDLPVTCQQFTAFQLRVLGYNEKLGDFEYAKTLDKALEVGLYTQPILSHLNLGAFLRGKAAIAMAEALLTRVKGSDTVRLIDTLVEVELFPQTDADAFALVIRAIKW